MTTNVILITGYLGSICNRFNCFGGQFLITDREKKNAARDKKKNLKLGYKSKAIGMALSPLDFIPSIFDDSFKIKKLINQ